VRRLSIGLRLTLWYLSIFALAQLVFGIGMWLILRENMRQLSTASLAREVQDVQRFLDSQASHEPVDALREALTEEYSAEADGDYLQIRDADGHWLYRSPLLTKQEFPPVTPAVPGKPSFQDIRLGDNRFRFVSEGINVHGRSMVVQFGASIEQEITTLNHFRNSLLAFAPGLLLLAGLVGYGMSRKALSPVDQVTRTARSITAQTLNQRLQPLHTGDELQRLTDTVNEMLDRIELAFTRVTEFTADASHELRTPITLIRTEAELALRRSRGEVEYREALRHILLEAERTTSLIGELLALARADSGRQALDIQPIDLRESLQEIASGWRQVANVRGLQFSERLMETELRVLGDAAALRRVVDILLDNAFKYTPAPGGTISLSSQEHHGRAVISVRDTGVGIAEKEHARIFERFYRVDRARSRELGGAGLGLAIAQWIVEQHKGTITVESTLGAGSIFRIELPLAAKDVSRELLLR
jgi:heavy metal sensor kinase